MAKSVTVIPATINPLTKLPAFSLAKRRTCGYARVSTDKDEQFTSYEAQVDYYTKFIKANAEWEFIKVYTDEGITGTNTKKRDGFKQMIEDALNGKIDLIVTKSVSRFARNTVDSLVTIRELKAKGVEVYFEKENIWTLDSKGELLLTIMSSLAQEESRSISENVTWGKRKSAADGKVSLGYKNFLGYDKGENGGLAVNSEQAVLVKRIYREFMHGKTSCMIAQELSSENIPTPSGKSTHWRVSVINSILTNEKYKGAALLQKSFTVDYLTKRMKTNEGEVPQYYVENIKDAFVKAFNILFDCKPEIVANCRTVAEHLTDCNLIDEKIMNLKQEQEVVAELIRKCISENASLPQDQKKYLKKYNDYAERFESISVKLADLNNEKILKKSRRDAFNKFLKTLSEIDRCIKVFDDELWLATVDKVIIKSDGEFKFIFRNKMEIEVMSTK